MSTVASTTLHQLLVRIYEANGVPHDEASIVADHQVEANLVGHDSHGAIRTSAYVEQLRKGDIVAGALFEVERENATTAVVNANWGFGFVQTERAMRLACEKAQAFGTGAVAIRYQGHIGRLGAYAEIAAREGMIGFVTADSGRGPKSVAPFGGREARLGTNPLCFAIPRRSGPPIVLDMATSAVAGGKVALSRARGERVPHGWIIDENGKATDDPSALSRGGALLPLGGDQGHKGYGMSFVVEILCGVLTGLGFGVAADGRHNDGSFLMAVDIASFRDIGEFFDEIEEFASYMKSTEPLDGVHEVLIPGEIEARKRNEHETQGVYIEDRTWDELMELDPQGRG